MRVVDLTPDREDEYERFVHGHQAALLYYSLRFRDFLVSLLDCSPRYAVAVSGGKIAGALPLMAARGRYGQVLNSLPYYGSNGGVLAEGPDAAHALQEWYQSAATDNQVAAATVMANPFDADPVALAHDLVDERVSAVTRFDVEDSDPGAQVLDLIDSSARRNIRRAAASGVVVHLENQSFAELQSLHRASMEAAGGEAKGDSFFTQVPMHFSPDREYKLYVARMEGSPVAALLLFYYGDTVEYYVPALHPEYRPFQPMAAILHRAMADAIIAGFSRWNWGGSWLSHSGLIRFKSKWGGRTGSYRYWTKVNQQGILLRTPEELVREYPGFYVVPFSALAQGSDQPPA